MTGAELAAYIGAAAWLPQIGLWLYAAWARPLLRVLPAANLAISYNGLGPMLNLTAAFSAKRKDALIERMEAIVIDERGSEMRLTWTFVNDIQHQISVPTGETLNIGRNQPATALNVLTTALVEKVVTFQDLEAMKAERQRTMELLDQYDYLKQADSATALEQCRKSKEWVRALEGFKARLLWHEGKYKVIIRAKELRSTHWHEEGLSFSLSKQNADDLRSNIGMFEQMAQALLAQKEGYPPKFPAFKWTFVEVAR